MSTAMRKFLENIKPPKIYPSVQHYNDKINTGALTTGTFGQISIKPTKQSHEDLMIYCRVVVVSRFQVRRNAVCQEDLAADRRKVMTLIYKANLKDCGML